MILLPNATAVIIRPRVVNDMGSEFVDWEHPERIKFPGPCHVQDGATTETFERADSVETAYTLWAPLAPAVKPNDRVEFTYTAPPVTGTVTGLQVHGRPRVMVDPVDPDESFQRVELTRLEG